MGLETLEATRGLKHRESGMSVKTGTGPSSDHTM